ncbi:MAG: hypothetical protein EA381_19750 [Planctomycetaceae bacterium]|nr:MAG: hypothetical protein EA381_19750 [Planctomycetaceae bacterium]
MFRLIRLLILFFVITWLFRQTAQFREAWDRTRQSSRWQVIEEELRGAGDDALDWAEEALRQRRQRD